ncbi:MAG TPA: MG2 domain-containing protein [Candidatus Acidoferrum sp.]|nr:MG2 domain-containing protein [Candidatus Acidoferrum sp.]
MRSKFMARLFFAAVSLFAVSGEAQTPNAYFSVSTNKTFLPDEKVGIRVYSTNVEALEFRVYKVKDPVAFFDRLDNVHEFGHVSPHENIDKRTFLERFHDWKHDLWVALRDFFRMQFSRRSRAHIRESQADTHKSNAAVADVFAQVPVLNSSQLVARWRQQMPHHFYSETNQIPVPSLAKGVYVVEATDGALRAYTVVLVTELGAVTKVSPGQVLVFAADRRTGAPVSDAVVQLWTEQKKNTQFKTDASGLVQTSIPQGRYTDVRVLAAHGDDVAVVTPYSYNLSSDPESDWTGYIYTDRPVYRPGHTAHFKAILRTREGEQFKIPAGSNVQVLIEDPNSKPVLQTTLAVSQFGSIHADFTLPMDAALGYYAISVSNAGGQRFQISGGFHVEEYKKPEYEVKVLPAKNRILQGNSIEATIEARYFFGEPVANANVKYVVHTSIYWSPLFERDEDEMGSGDAQGEGDEQDYDYGGEQTLEQSGKLDANGRLKIQVPTTINDRRFDVRYRIEARVTDEGNREISGRNAVIATYGSFLVGVSTETYFFQKGETIRATVYAKDYDGKPVRTSARVELVRNSNWSRSQQEAVLVSQNVETDATGAASVQIPTQETGGLSLRVTARTPEARDVTGSTWIWIPNSDQGWSYSEGREIRMLADKKSYKVGETAHVAVLTGMPEAYLLVTTEGRTVQSKRVIHATSPSASIDVPIQGENQPNVFVAVAFWKDNKFYQSSRNLKVPAVQKQLQIDIQPSQKQFQPGQKGSYALRVRDNDGKPVVGEFSIGVVDEAIYSIYPDQSGDIHQFFYGPVYDRVSTESSLGFYFSGEAGKREMFLAYRAQNTPRALAQLKPETPVQPKVRKLFPDTALWLADVRTDTNGHADAQIEFPDSLTSWRATVRGATLDTKVGSATNNVIVRKNLMVRMVVPRFFRQGDEVTVSAIVHNYLMSEKTVQVSLDASGLELLSPASGQVTVPSRGEAKFDWRVRAKSEHESVLTAKALTNEESDAMELTLPITPVGVKITDAKSGSQALPEQEDKVQVNLPANFDQSAPTVDVVLSSSYAGSIFSALDYLTSYPYGCTEQTMSSFLPNIVVAKALKDLKLPQSVDTPELEKKIRAGMDRLKDFQHEDGGWGWWKDDESQVFMTAYVVSGFAQAQAAGYGVDSTSLSRAEKYLHGALANHPNMRDDLRAYVVYALALNSASTTEEIQSAWTKRSSMTSQGLSMLGLALHATGDLYRAKEIARSIESAAVVTDREASWPATYDYFMEFALDDGAETTAYAVRLLSLVSPESPLLPKAAFWLVSHRNGGYFWDSTKQTAMVVFGLTEYLKASHEFDANFRAELSVNGTPVSAKQFTAADGLNPVQPTFHLIASQLHPGANEIRIRKSGPGRLYWSTSAAFYSNDKRLVQNNNLSLNITRDYFRLTPESSGSKIVYRTDPLNSELHVGDILAVRVTVAGGEWRYLLMEDPIPAGAEFIARDDLYELKERPSWWGYWYTRREFHDDRAAIFQEYFKGQHQYVYLLKIVNPGKFQVSPAMVQPMYQPSIFATSDAASMEVK